ncbi:hypothetical protein [Sphingomonas sp.]|uniref:hypothetical protein n=1 Tax=Sphingomonas sp. TaxID=28214 RepID=UPI002ED8B09E
MLTIFAHPAYSQTSQGSQNVLGFVLGTDRVVLERSWALEPLTTSQFRNAFKVRSNAFSDENDPLNLALPNFVREQSVQQMTLYFDDNGKLYRVLAEIGNRQGSIFDGADGFAAYFAAINSAKTRYVQGATTTLQSPITLENFSYRCSKLKDWSGYYDARRTIRAESSNIMVARAVTEYCDPQSPEAHFSRGAYELLILLEVQGWLGIPRGSATLKIIGCLPTGGYNTCESQRNAFKKQDNF